MLPEHYRYQIKNESGVTVDVEFKRQGVGVGSSELSVTFGAWSADLGTTGLANGSTHETSDVDNSSAGFHADNFEIASNATQGSPDGDVIVYFQPRGDGASDWPTDETGWVAAVSEISSTGTVRSTGQV